MSEREKLSAEELRVLAGGFYGHQVQRLHDEHAAQAAENARLTGDWLAALAERDEARFANAERVRAAEAARDNAFKSRLRFADHSIGCACAKCNDARQEIVRLEAERDTARAELARVREERDALGRLSDELWVAVQDNSKLRLERAMTAVQVANDNLRRHGAIAPQPSAAQDPCHICDGNRCPTCCPVLREPQEPSAASEPAPVVASIDRWAKCVHCQQPRHEHWWHVGMERGEPGACSRYASSPRFTLPEHPEAAGESGERP